MGQVMTLVPMEVQVIYYLGVSGSLSELNVDLFSVSGSDLHITVEFKTEVFVYNNSFTFQLPPPAS